MTKLANSLTITLTLCVLLFAAPLSADTTAELPDTPSGRYVGELLKAYNTGDEAVWREFLLQDAKAAADSSVFQRRIGAFRMIWGDVGVLDLAKVSDSKEYSITTVLRAHNPGGQFEWLEFRMDLDTLPPHGWGGLSMRPTNEPLGDLPAGQLSPEQITAQLKEFVEKLAVEDRFSGTVLLAKDGKPRYRAAFGEACKRYGVPNQIDTKFNLGSMNKMFTGVAICQLAQAGKLAFTDTVGKFLPDYQNAEVRDKVTIHELLTHTSGMQDYWEEIFAAPWWEIKTVQEMNDVFVDEGLLFEPGSEFHYSNSGPIVLGLIIEAISGEDYFDYIQEHIARPAGMINSDCYEVDRPVPNLAIGYTKMNYNGEMTDDGWYNNLFMHVVKGGPAGGGYSTVDDLLAFANALMSHKLLNKAYTDTLTTGKVEMGGPDVMYAYLFGDMHEDGLHHIGHNGGAPGINASLRIYPELGYTVAVMSNYDMGAAIVAGRAQQLLAHK